MGTGLGIYYHLRPSSQSDDKVPLLPIVPPTTENEPAELPPTLSPNEERVSPTSRSTASDPSGSVTSFIATPPDSSEPIRPPTSKDLASYDENLALILKSIQNQRAAGAITLPQIASLLSSADKRDQVTGLTLAAGLGWPIDPSAFSSLSPEVILAALDFCRALFPAQNSRHLLEQWINWMGGLQVCGETAHTLLLEERLPLGGGTSALELMISVNEPGAVLVGLYEFAVHTNLPPTLRGEALLRLHDFIDPISGPNLVGDLLQQLREDRDPWTPRAERLLRWMEKPPISIRSFLEENPFPPEPGTLADLALYLAHEIRSGRKTFDSEAANNGYKAIRQLDAIPLSGEDRLACEYLKLRWDTVSPPP